MKKRLSLWPGKDDEEKETEVSTSGSVTINAKDKSKGNGLIIVLTSVGGAAILGAALYFYLLKNEKANRRKCVKLRTPLKVFKCKSNDTINNADRLSDDEWNKYFSE